MAQVFNFTLFIFITRKVDRIQENSLKTQYRIRRSEL